MQPLIKKTLGWSVKLNYKLSKMSNLRLFTLCTSYGNRPIGWPGIEVKTKEIKLFVGEEGGPLEK